MSELTQANREIRVTTPLGDDVLLIRAMSGREELGRLFEYQLELLSETTDADFNKLVGDTITVSLEMGDNKTRYFNGYVSRFAQTGISGQNATYQATVVPWLWFLTRTSDCRIFQKITVPDIIKKVFEDAGFTDVKYILNGTYREWVYCVQYRETDFNFVSRLMEQEGIYYFFKHEEDKHTLILADGYSSHEKVSKYEVSYHPPGESIVTKEEHIYDWDASQQLQPCVYVHKDFDFTAPKKDLLAKSKQQREHAKADLEIYDYPGEYTEFGDGDTYSRLRLEELQAHHKIFNGQADVRCLCVGGLFKLNEHPRADLKREYLITSATYELEAGDYGAGGSGGEAVYSCNIATIDAKDPYRAQRITPKPAVQGPQTAIVVGESGEEIWTDKYGRVKVQFHWDRYGASDQESSCWVRVSYPWAGKNWGAVAIPRMGQEVIVEFLEGDPDRPIITGRVYNNDNMPPYELPANATQSGVKSRSLKEGSPDNFNEIRMEDKKGEEQLYIHAEKNQDNVVENDETTEVGHDRTENVGNDETITIGNDRTENVEKNENITIGENRTENVGKNEDITIGDNRTESVGKNESISIGENRDESVGKDESISISGNRTENVGKDETISITANRTEDVGKDETVTISGKRSHDVGKDDMLNVGKKLTMVAADQITLQTGEASIIMKKNGDIVIKGKDITLKGSGKINAKASGDVTIKGSKVKQN